jgi:hypothetical protein
MSILNRPYFPRKTQHEKFADLARQAGADENEDAFVAKLRGITRPKPKALKKKDN